MLAALILVKAKHGFLKERTRTAERMIVDDAKLVVAIDIGSTYSGYAYSCVSNPDQVICSSFGGSEKTPTSVLVDKGKNGNNTTPYVAFICVECFARA